MSTRLPLGADWQGLRVLVMGLGQFGGGVAAARYLAQNGAQVCVTDLRDAQTLARSIAALEEFPIRFVLGRHDARDFENVDFIVANPAVPPNVKWLQSARKRGIRVTSEMELFLQECRGTLLFVSGTHGKSSTVTFLHQLLRGWRQSVYLGGNLGRPLLDVPEAHAREALCIVEISSYQLDALPREDPSLRKALGAGLTALAPDHLERHGDLESYFATKARLFELCVPGATALLPHAMHAQEPFAALPSRHSDLRWTTYGARGDLRVTDHEFWMRHQPIPAPEPWALGGEFQRHNVLLALGLAQAVGMPMDVAGRKLPHLTGLPHRMQRVPTPERPDAPRIHDNGVSTTPESTLAGLLSLPAPAALLIGGQAKAGLDYETLMSACARRGDAIFTFGAAAQSLAALAVRHGAQAQAHVDLAAAFETAWAAACAGESTAQAPQDLLFSPACASFDAYPNFQARALEFLDLVSAKCIDLGHTQSRN